MIALAECSSCDEPFKWIDKIHWMHSNLPIRFLIYEIGPIFETVYINWVFFVDALSWNELKWSLMKKNK